MLQEHNDDQHTMGTANPVEARGAANSLSAIELASAVSGGPTINIDAWFAKREEIIEMLRAKRENLLKEVEQTEERLRILGVEIRQELDEADAPEPPADMKAKVALTRSAKAKAPAKKPAKRVVPKPGEFARMMGPKPSAALDAILKGMTKPESMRDIENRTGMGHTTVHRALQAGLENKTLQRSGTGRGTLWSMRH